MKQQPMTKRCPRCERKMGLAEPKCPSCGLVFSRLAKATNKAAKQAIKRREYNKVILDTVLPQDVNKWKLFFMALFLGLFGGHAYYVGRYKRGIFYSVAFVLVAIVAAFPLAYWANMYWELAFSLLVLPVGFSFIIWFMDVFAILCNKFKVPISIPEEYVVEDKNGKQK